MEQCLDHLNGLVTNCSMEMLYLCLHATTREKLVGELIIPSIDGEINHSPNKRRRSRSPSPRLEKPKHSKNNEPIDLTSFNYCKGTEDNAEVLTSGLNFSDDMLRKWLVESVVEVVYDGISPMIRERLTHKMIEKVHAFFDGRSEQNDDDMLVSEADFEYDDVLEAKEQSTMDCETEGS